MDGEKSYAPPVSGQQEESGSISRDNSQIWYRIIPGYCIRDFCDESLVIPVGADAIAEQQIAILSPVGRFLWDRLQNRQTFSDLLSAVLEEYEVTREEAISDIKEFLSELKNHKYLKEEECGK